MGAAIYVRVSTMNQVDRDSLSTQESRLKAYCEAQNLSVYDIYKDAGFSAKDTNRPALKKLFKDIEAGKIQTILVTKLDRITRSLRDLVKLVEFFAEKSVKFVSITQNVDSSGPFGRFMRDLLGLIAQLEREVTAERVSEDMHYRALQGKWNGGVIPFGYTTQQRIFKELTKSGINEYKAIAEATNICPEQKKLYIDEKESKIVKDIFNTYIETRSLRATTHTLNSKGIKTRNNATWAAASIRRVITNPTYTGKVWYGKRKTNLHNGKLEPTNQETWKINEGEHKAIISKKIFDEASSILVKKSNKPTRAKNKYLLSGIIKCGKCGGSMYGYTFTKKGTDKTYVYYKCQNNSSKGKSVCKGMTVQAKPLDDFVINTLMELSKNVTFLNDKEKMLKTLKEECNNTISEKNEELDILMTEEKNLQSKLDNLLDKLEDNLIDDMDFKKRYQAIKNKLSDNRTLQEKVKDKVVQPSTAYEALNASFEEISSFGGNWDFLEIEGQKLKLQTIVNEIKVLEDKVDIQVFLDVDDMYCTDSHVSQNLEKSTTKDRCFYNITLKFPKDLFNKDYPTNPKTFGEKLRKARLDAGLNIRELAEKIGVTEDTVINWELRGMMPLKKGIRERVECFIKIGVSQGF